MTFTTKAIAPDTQTLMKLHWSPRSPFVRKVMIVLHETGQLNAVDCVRNVVGMNQPNEQVLLDNPLNKIPTLVLPNGQALFDSRVICEYLDRLHQGHRLIPQHTEAYFQAMTWQALGDGFLDLLLVWRNWFSERGVVHDAGNDAYLTTFSLKAQRILNTLERQAADLVATPLTVGHVSIACALGHLDFRWQVLNWRDNRPQLAAWYATFSARPSAIATVVHDDGAAVAQ